MKPGVKLNMKPGPRIRTFIALTALAALTACAAFTMVPAGEVKTAAGLTVTTDIAWSRQSGGPYETWTLDGLELQQLVFIETENGEPFIGGAQPYEKGMNPLELRDMLKGNLESGGFTRIEETAFKPGAFGAFKGHRIEFDYTLEDGLNRKGVAVFFVHDENAYLVMYFGAAQVYFDRGLRAFEKIAASLRPS